MLREILLWKCMCILSVAYIGKGKKANDTEKRPEVFSVE